MLSQDAMGEAGSSLNGGGAAGFERAERGPVVGRHKDRESAVTPAWDTPTGEESTHYTSVNSSAGPKRPGHRSQNSAVP